MHLIIPILNSYDKVANYINVNNNNPEELVLQASLLQYIQDENQHKQAIDAMMVADPNS